MSSFLSCFTIIRTIWKTYLAGFPLSLERTATFSHSRSPNRTLLVNTPHASQHIPPSPQIVCDLRPSKRGRMERKNSRKSFLSPTIFEGIFFSCGGPSVPLHLLNPLNVPPPRLGRKVFCINRSRNCKWTLPSDTFILLVE